MIAPVFVQPASAADSTSNSDLPEDCIDILKDETVPLTDDPLDISNSDIIDDEEVNPQVNINDRDMGVGIRRITVYPLARNTETGKLIYNTNIYKRANYINWTQTQSLKLTNSETLSLMQRMHNYLDTKEEKHDLVGWYVQSSVEFDYAKPEYALYHRCGTNVDENNEVEYRRELSSAGTQSFSLTFFYPEGKDIQSDYYFIGITGGCYYISSLDVHLGNLFGTYVSFNN